MSLKLRLNLIITLLLLSIMIVGTISTIYNARKDVAAEIASTAILALHMLDAEVLLFNAGTGWLTYAGVDDHSIFRLEKLRNVRHLKIDFYDEFGRLRDSNYIGKKEEVSPPSWFIALIDSVTGEMPVTKRQIYKAGHIIGELVVTPDPSNEIAEVWDDAKSMLILLALFFIVANILIYFAVRRALQPIDSILSALTGLESGNLTTRLPQFSLPELAGISEKFNVMAETLQISIANNHDLTQKLIQLQEDERKKLARELHDEIGQHLTAIHIDASTILKAKTLEEANESAFVIVQVARKMMDIVHTMLQRLRPSGLDELGLTPALQELIAAWSHRHKAIQVESTISEGFSQVNEDILLTIYRIIQECLTNISRHASASYVIISVEKEEDIIQLSVEDNGKGFDPAIKPKGFGLAGIRERVDGANGTLIIKASTQGVKINVILPCLEKGEQ